MEQALDEARDAYARGEFPVGCVIAWQGRVISSGSRTGTAPGHGRPSEIDHAEIRALKAFETMDGDFDASEAVLFCTMEPCLMCFAAIVFSGIKTVVYAYEDVMGGGTGCDFSRMPSLYRDSHMTVVPGLLREKSLELFQGFFQNPENRYWKGSALERYTLAQKV
ncbi:MAG: nucleoside deaminase [Pseudomonadota bacterium]